MNAIREILSSKTGNLSSKRVCGSLGWLAILFVFIFCAVKEVQAPTMVDALILGSTGLLGVDSVTEIFKKTNTNENEEIN